MTKSPARYCELSETDFLERIEKARALMGPACRLCPEKCGVDRRAGETGACGADDQLRIASADLHFGEEPPISGRRGSGTIFVTHCNLACVYCQNYPISQSGNGVETNPAALAEIMLRLQEQGAHNINWVTPTHAVPHLLAGLRPARAGGLTIPIVYNSSGYDDVETLQLLEGIVDIYLTDMRYSDGGNARRYSGASDYPEVNRRAVIEMHRQVGDLKLDEAGIARTGLLIRHLVLPGGISGTEAIMRFLAADLSPCTYVSLMSQYFPAYKATGIPEIARRITPEEYDEAKTIMERYGLTQGWVQELE
ncbi:MAG: radical SAM protein [Deltaproteobacteria bacterium]|nr:radical SAM protein [Deltaproteobacteria bacterium]